MTARYIVRARVALNTAFDYLTHSGGTWRVPQDCLPPLAAREFRSLALARKVAGSLRRKFNTDVNYKAVRLHGRKA